MHVVYIEHTSITFLTFFIIHHSHQIMWWERILVRSYTRVLTTGSHSPTLDLERDHVELGV